MAQIEHEEEVAEAARQQGDSVFYFWRVSRKPKNLEVGDKCFFVWNDAVRAYHVFLGFSENMICQVTGTHYPGICIVLDPVIYGIDPIPMKGFRGYRYKKT